MSVNKVICVGYLGRDPESRTFSDGGRVTNITVATSEKWKDKATGEVKEHTEWIRVNFTGRLAEVAADYLKKGSLVYVEGSLRTRKWTDKDGVERYATEVKAEGLKMLGGRAAGSTNTTNAASHRSEQPAAAAPTESVGHETQYSDMDDDIPF